MFFSWLFKKKNLNNNLVLVYIKQYDWKIYKNVKHFKNAVELVLECQIVYTGTY